MIKIKRVFDTLKDAGYPPPTLRYLSEISGIQYNHLSKIYNQEGININSDTLKKLVRGLYEYYNPLMPPRAFKERMDSIFSILFEW